mgnify:FL=1
MKTAAAIYCLMPWICFAFFRFAESIGAASPTTVPAFLFTWVAISPIVTAMGLFVANTEGRRND